eukprot:m.182602 g.182602  ORF g.182602 m.182602 type:complete len:550 (+) comp15578_c0_seq1:186-1835(+)
MTVSALSLAALCVVHLYGQGAVAGLAPPPPPPTGPRMQGVWGDNMVLQHDNPMIHGCGAPHKAPIAALVTPGDEVARTVSDEIGCFVLRLAPRAVMNASSQGVGIAVKVSTGNQSGPFFAQASNVLYGHTILCGGQSNMVHPLSYDYNATAQIAASVDLPNLRLFQVGRQWSDDSGVDRPLGCHDNGTMPTLTPKCPYRNKWHVASTYAGNFSAVCYLTGQELMRTELGTNAAVGLVESDWGGSTQETWISKAFATTIGCSTGPDPPPDTCPITDGTLSPIRNNCWGCLYRGMIEPLTKSLRPFLILWYQGEANQDDPGPQYQCRVESMIREWRFVFNNSALPFFLVQLAPLYQPQCKPDATPPQASCITFPHTRIAQASATTNVTAPSGYCVTHDLGDQAGGIHPHNKTEVGRRLALAIRSQVFGTPNLPHISVAQRAEWLPGSSTLDVAFTDSTQTLQWGPTHNCTLCCDETMATVEVCAASNCSDPTVTWTSVRAAWNASANSLRTDVVTPHPHTVRYAWSNFPQCVLFDQNQLPVGPFSLPVGSA